MGNNSTLLHLGPLERQGAVYMQAAAFLVRRASFGSIALFN